MEPAEAVVGRLRDGLRRLVEWADNERGDDFGTREWTEARALLDEGVLTLVDVARAARELEKWQPSYRPAMDQLHPQHRHALIALRAALARLEEEAA